MDYLLASIFRWTRPMFAFSRPRRRVGLREQDGVDGKGDLRRIGESAKLSSNGFRDGRMGRSCFTA